MVYGLENKDGFFYNFEISSFTVWGPNCSLPSKQLAEDILLILEENDDFLNVKIIPVPAD